MLRIIRSSLLCSFLLVSAASHAYESSEDSQESLFTVPENENTDDTSTQTYQTDLRQPGPDFGSFPYSAAVVTPGQIYLETKFDQNRNPDQSGIGALLRLGITPGLELRLSSDFLKETNPDTVTGLGPLGVGFKYHAVDSGDSSLRPAIGIELDVELPTASNDQLDDGEILPSITVNLDHTLPDDFSFSWNAGVGSAVGDDNDTFLQSSLLWALTYDINIDISVYLTGYVDYPANSTGNEKSSVAGTGVQWFWSNRIAFNGLYATALTDQSPDDIIQLSLSFAF